MRRSRLGCICIHFCTTVFHHPPFTTMMIIKSLYSPRRAFDVDVNEEEERNPTFTFRITSHFVVARTRRTAPRRTERSFSRTHHRGSLGACHADSRRYPRRVVSSHQRSRASQPHRSSINVALAGSEEQTPRRGCLKKCPDRRCEADRALARRNAFGWMRTAGMIDLKDAWKRRFQTNRNWTCGWS